MIRRACTSHRPARPLLLLLVLALAAVLAAPAARAYDKPTKARIAQLSDAYRTWLEDVELIISDEELGAFLDLDKDYQRDAFIKHFWRVRDPYPDTARNEYEESYEERLRIARDNYQNLQEDRSRILLLNGLPTATIEGRCSEILKPLEIWYYAGSDQVGFEFFVIFYREGSNYRLWRPFDGIERLMDTLMGDRSQQGRQGLLQRIALNCRDGEKIAAAIAYTQRAGNTDYSILLSRLEHKPEARHGEWVATFNSYTTDVPDDAPKLPATLTVGFPGRHQNRTVVQGTLAVPREAAAAADLAGHSSFDLVLTGEVLRDGELFDNFRYKFDLPAASVAGEAKLPLVFQRYLRPGTYDLVVKLEDLNGGTFFREHRDLEVPDVGSAPPPVVPTDSETAELLAEANAALSTGDVTLHIVDPQGQLHTGFVRFDTLATGPGIDHVTFALDGRPLLIKRSPPYSVELDLGSLPRPRRLTAVAYDGADEELARDQLLINAGGQRFGIDLVEPRRGKTYHSSLNAEAKVQVPEGQTVDRVEFYVNETRVATLYQEPWVQPIVLPADQSVAYVRAVAYLPDGNSTEDLVFVNSPDYLEELDVQFVELYATVTDRQGHPIEGLTRDDFAISEDGRPQQVVRFDQVRDLPIHAAILMDVSASMEGDLDATRQAALDFFQQAVHPKDRAAVITFNDHPNLAVKFTSDLPTLAGGLAGLKAERGTALYDSVIFGLYYFNGVKGQRALLILSDGKDESSRFSWDQTLEYARRAGVTVYAIALRDDAAYKRLGKLSEATGGRSYLIKDPAQLAAIYDSIQRELRSKYLLAYQSTNTSGSTDFRRIDVKVSRPGAEVKTLQGYYP